MQESVEVPDPDARLVGVNVQVSPLVLTVLDRLTAPLKPSWEVTVMVAVPAVPAFVLMLDEERSRV